MTQFAVYEALAAGPSKRVLVTDDPRFACIAAFRRCRMHQHADEPDPLDAQWTSVEALVEGERIPLIEMRRLKHGVRLDTYQLQAALGFDPAQHFVLRQEDDHLMIEGPR